MESRLPGSSLLFVSPVVPAPTGNGLAMRAHTVLQALTGRYRVSFLVASLYPPHGVSVPPELAARCREIVVLPPGPDPDAPSASAGRQLLTQLQHALLGRAGSRMTSRGQPAIVPFQDAPFDVVHVFRLASLPVAEPWLNDPGRPPQRHLDLDDIESTTHQRLAALYRLNGEATRAAFEEQEAARFAILEAAVARTFDRIYLCSERDRETFSASTPDRKAAICVLPNGLPVPPAPAPLPPTRTDQPFMLLFVGTLGYSPNEDAVLQLCRHILPLVRERAGRDVRAVIVGGGLRAEVAARVRAPGVQLVGAVPDLAPWYKRADAVIVPIRAGGGTRIKILEAFSYRRPVVSTTLGAEGIKAQPDEHLLLADTPDAFAAQCVRLLTEPGLAAALTERAHTLFSAAYSTDAVTRALANLP